MKNAVGSPRGLLQVSGIQVQRQTGKRQGGAEPLPGPGSQTSCTQARGAQKLTVLVFGSGAQLGPVQSLPFLQVSGGPPDTASSAGT